MSFCIENTLRFFFLPFPFQIQERKKNERNMSQSDCRHAPLTWVKKKLRHRFELELEPKMQAIIHLAQIAYIRIKS